MAPILLLLLACDPAEHKGPEDSQPWTSQDSNPELDSHTGDPTPDDSGHTGETAHSGHTGDTGDPPLGSGAVILFIGDGMGPAHVAGGGDYAHGAAGTLSMETLPTQGRLRTASLSGITDSAAAATVYAAGVKTYNDRLAIDRDGASLDSLIDVARARGMATGVVSTDTLTGATPSAFLVNVTSRYSTSEIANQIAANLPNVLLGGGAAPLGPLLEGAPVQLVTNAAALGGAVVDDRPLVGLFADYTMPWVADGLGEAPSLAEMTGAALARLGEAPNGFFLIVEGARIDHASHGRSAAEVHPETAAFDEAIALAMAWAEGRDDTTLVVTADHECGGMIVADTGTAGEIPETSWRWGAHTNADVPVFALGAAASVLDGQRSDALWVHEVLAAAIEGREVTPPETVPLVDGWLDDLGDRVVTQRWDTSFGAGYNQLDGIRATADTDGVRIGLDGVFQRENNAVVLLFDLDLGEGTGLGGADALLPDTDGELESILSRLDLDIALDGLGFDLAIVSLRAREIAIDELEDDSGLRGLRAPWGDAGDLWWLPAIVNFDDGNVDVSAVEALDAGPTGETEHGMEALLPWSSVWPDGLPAEGQTIGVLALIVGSDGGYASNQALPPLPSGDEPGLSSVTVSAVLQLTVDSDGVIVGLPEVLE